MNSKIKFSVILFCAALLTACSSSIYKTVYPTLNDGKYDSEFPYKSSSQEIEKIGETIRMLNCIAFYDTYLFEYSANVSLDMIKNDEYQNSAYKTTTYSNTSAGTATIIYSDLKRVALLTCAHVVNFPDTIISYYETTNGRPTRKVESISIKLKQSNYIPDFPAKGEVDLITLDNKLDVAVLGKEYRQDSAKPFSVFNYPIGKSNELEWGSFVYVLGFPLNQKMISNGIVSLTSDRTSGFLVDAVFNRGFSGGIVLAIRDGVPNFELVGLVKSVPAEYENVLRPAVGTDTQTYNPIIPYEDKIFVERRQSIKYGVTKIIGIESILSFMLSQKDLFESKGYNFVNFFK